MTKHELINNIMGQIADTGWDSISLPAQDYIARKEDFFPFFYEWMAQQHLELFVPGGDYDRKEKILEILLVKFELWGSYRAAILELRTEALGKPKLMRSILCADYKFLRRIWVAHGLDGESIISQAKEKGVFLISWAAFFVWIDDTGDDLSKTMAFIDKALSFGEQLSENYA
ncbi:MAG: hypothetical protein WCG05_04970 [Alphaproteobacteria bacterium]